MDFKVLADLIENGLPFQKMLGIRVASIEEGRIRLFIPFREDLIGDARRHDPSGKDHSRVAGGDQPTWEAR